MRTWARNSGDELRIYVAVFRTALGLFLALLLTQQLSNPKLSRFVVWSYASAFPLFLKTKPSRMQVVAAIAIGSALYLESCRRIGISWHMAGIAIGLGSVVTMLYRLPVLEPNRRLFWIAVGFPVFFIVVNLVHLAVIALTPDLIDKSLREVDKYFGMDFSPPAMNWALTNPALYSIVWGVYLALPFAAAIVIISLPSDRVVPFLRTCLIAGLCAVPFYLIFPAVGPAHLASLAFAPRNCVPSLHITWAFLLVHYSRGVVGKSWTGVFGILTGIATIASGEHYVIDLIVAVPFTALVIVISERLVPLTFRKALK
jgi:hypothetical protein